MIYPELPNKDNVSLYTAREMQRYAIAAIELNIDEDNGDSTLEDTISKLEYTVSALRADIKVKDSTIRTQQMELLKYRNMDEPVDWNELQRLRLRVKELEKQVSDYNWTIYPDRMGQ